MRTYRAACCRFLALLCVTLLTTTLSARAAAINFGDFSIDFTEIAGSAAEDSEGFKNPVGRVDDDYSISTFEIRRSHIEAYNTANDPVVTGVPDITLADMTLYGGNGSDRPATGISWYEAAHFINYLNITHGASPAYKFNGAMFDTWAVLDSGYDASNVFRNSNALYYLPSVDEWHKAAYGSPGGTWYHYPTGSDAVPTAVASGTGAGEAVYNQALGTGPADVDLAGGLNAWDVVGMGGNAWEWEETAFDLGNNDISEDRGLRGGSWLDDDFSLQSSGRNFGFDPAFEFIDVGFRVAGADLAALQAAEAAAGFGGGGPGGPGIPEPSRAVLLLLGLVGMLSTRRRARSSL